MALLMLPPCPTTLARESRTDLAPQALPDYMAVSRHDDSPGHCGRAFLLSRSRSVAHGRRVTWDLRRPDCLQALGTAHPDAPGAVGCVVRILLPRVGEAASLELLEGQSPVKAPAVIGVLRRLACKEHLAGVRNVVGVHRPVGGDDRAGILPYSPAALAALNRSATPGRA